MARDPKYDVLFEPVRIGPKTMKNRFYQTPHCTGFGVDRPGASAYLRGMKAEGGWAVVHTEWCSIHPEADESPQVTARIWDDGDVRNLSLTVEKVHEHNALAGVELYYGGAQRATLNYETRIPTRAVSPIAVGAGWRPYGFAMDRDEIRELQGFWVAAARRARSAGFDVITLLSDEVNSVFEGFLMRYFNKRSDEYGGSLENRARFAVETLTAVRDAVGDDCALSMRLCVDTCDGSDEGIRVEDEAAGLISMADDLVDVWDLEVGGGTGTARWGHSCDSASSRFFPENYQATFTSKVRPYTTKPIVDVGRFTDPATMVAAVRSGQLDIIGAARPSIADPFLPRKIEEGRLGEIRECIGSNVCVSRIGQAVPIVCTQNPTIGEEYRRGWHPERFAPVAQAAMDILIVGAGPAGMECAMVLGKRGIRRVHLVDAEPEVGGAVRWISRLPGLGEWGRVIDYRLPQLKRLLNVEIITGERLDADAVLNYGADIVVIATGSRWSADGLNGFTRTSIRGAEATMQNVLTPEQIMVEGKTVPGERVLVYDCDGYFMATCLAERLARDRKHVTLVTPLDMVAPFGVLTHEDTETIRRLSELGVERVVSHVLLEWNGTRAIGGAVGDLARARRVEWRADALVLVTQRLPQDDLYRELRRQRGPAADAGIRVFRIGDCVSPRLIADCVFDGHRLAREIDTDDPATPLPFIRENRILGPGEEDHPALVASLRTLRVASEVDV